MKMKILKVDVGGWPIAWISREDGARLYCLDQVAWEAGAVQITLFGGHSRITNARSVLRISSIVATRSVHKRADMEARTPALCNARLFARDNYLCLYCGHAFAEHQLTRDHIVPVSAGGRDEWENVVSACRPCNHHKDNHALADIGMRLLAVPYIPNRAEGLILENRRILTDQMAFLRTRVGASSRLRDA